MLRDGYACERVEGQVDASDDRQRTRQAWCKSPFGWRRSLGRFGADRADKIRLVEKSKQDKIWPALGKYSHSRREHMSLQ